MVQNDSFGACPVFPASNAWNTDVSGLPVAARSDAYVASIGAGGHLHADFGGNGAYGIPYVAVRGQPGVPVDFTAYGDESDPGPYPVPLAAPVEGGASSDGDRHVLAVDVDHCKVYEMYRAFPRDGHWDADSGAVFDLRSNALRPDGWTSADAAGLPILPGLVRPDEIRAGAINHALRFTVARTQRGYIHPATHQAGSTDSPEAPPMGARFRLRASFSLRHYHGAALIVLRCLKRYGMFVADNGSNWFISGATYRGWNDDDLNQLKTVPGSAFQVVSTGRIRH